MTDSRDVDYLRSLDDMGQRAEAVRVAFSTPHAPCHYPEGADMSEPPQAEPVWMDVPDKFDCWWVCRRRDGESTLRIIIDGITPDEKYIQATGGQIPVYKYEFARDSDPPPYPDHGEPPKVVKCCNGGNLGWATIVTLDNGVRWASVCKGETYEDADYLNSLSSRGWEFEEEQQ